MGSSGGILRDTMKLQVAIILYLLSISSANQDGLTKRNSWQGSEMSGTSCELCQETAKWIESLVLEEEDDIQQLVLRVCEAIKPFSESAYGYCDHFDETYLKDIWELIVETYLTPEKLCVKACP